MKPRAQPLPPQPILPAGPAGDFILSVARVLAKYEARRQTVAAANDGQPSPPRSDVPTSDL